MKSRSSKYEGGVALTTVIVLVTLLILAGTTIVATSIDLGKSSASNSSYLKAELNAYACLEEVIQEIKFNPFYSGTTEITLETGVCTVNIEYEGGSTIREITIFSNYQQSTFADTYMIDIAQSPFDIL